MALKPFWIKKFHLGITGEDVKNILTDAEKNNVVSLTDEFVNVSITATQAVTLISTGNLENVDVVGLTAGDVFPDSLMIGIEGLGIVKGRFVDFRTQVRYDAFMFDLQNRPFYIYLYFFPDSPDRCTVRMIYLNN